MTYDDDTFAMQFDDAVNNMHAKRAEALGSNVWRQVEAKLPRADAADPRASGRDLGAMSGQTSRRERTTKMDATLATPLGMSRSRGFSAWLAAGLAVLLAVSGFYLNMMNGNNGGQQNLAWAPGQATPDSDIALASPAASPSVYTYGPEYACTIEPLTADGVVATVLNPTAGYKRLGYDSPQYGKYEESRGAWPTPYDTSTMYRPTADEESIAQGAIDTANMFWNCLMTGTAYQVWALTNPDLIQAEVLLNLPVVRTEADIRAYIEEWGPRRYSAGLGLIWIDLGNSDPAEVGVQFHGHFAPKEGEMGGISVGVSPNDREITYAVVTLTLPEGNENRQGFAVQISLQLHPNGTWTVVGYDIPSALG